MMDALVADQKEKTLRKEDSEAIIEIVHLQKSFGDNHVLTDFNLSILPESQAYAIRHPLAPGQINSCNRISSLWHRMIYVCQVRGRRTQQNRAYPAP